MTIRELRQLLFKLDQDDITVKELRKMLFDIDDQDKDVNDLVYSELVEGGTK